MAPQALPQHCRRGVTLNQGCPEGKKRGELRSANRKGRSPGRSLLQLHGQDMRKTQNHRNSI